MEAEGSEILLLGTRRRWSMTRRYERTLGWSTIEGAKEKRRRITKMDAGRDDTSTFCAYVLSIVRLGIGMAALCCCRVKLEVAEEE